MCARTKNIHVYIYYTHFNECTHENIKGMIKKILNVAIQVSPLP